MQAFLRVTLATLTGWLVLGLGTWAQAPSPAEPELVDRILAVVDEDPILESDLERLVGLGLAERQPEEEEAAFRRRLLDELIEQKLRFHEIDRYGFAQIPLDEVDMQYEDLETRLGGEQAMQAKLESLELDEEGVRQLLARQLMVLIYVEERLGPRVLVGIDDIQTYYDETLVPEMRERGATAPPVSQVREQIRELLRQQRLNEEIELWTEELRLDADVEDYLEAEHPELPPAVIDRSEGPRKGRASRLGGNPAGGRQRGDVDRVGPAELAAQMELAGRVDQGRAARVTGEVVRAG